MVYFPDLHLLGTGVKNANYNPPASIFSFCSHLQHTDGCSGNSRSRCLFLEWHQQKLCWCRMARNSAKAQLGFYHVVTCCTNSSQQLYVGGFKAFLTHADGAHAWKTKAQNQCCEMLKWSNLCSIWHRINLTWFVGLLPALPLSNTWFEHNAAITAGNVLFNFPGKISDSLRNVEFFFQCGEVCFRNNRWVTNYSLSLPQPVSCLCLPVWEDRGCPCQVLCSAW